MNNSWVNELPPKPNYLIGGKASKHLFCVSKDSWSLARPFQTPYLQFLRGGEAFKLFVTPEDSCFSIFTVSGSHLGRAATVWWGIY
jgi:hypothetical protein